jgi:hypothetical protein
MKKFMWGFGQFVAYFLLILIGMAVLIAVGYGLGFVISVHDKAVDATGGVCTSTLCQ